MKRGFAIAIIMIAVLCMSIGLIGCTPKTVYFLPEIESEIEGLTIEHVNNINSDYIDVFSPIKLSEQFTHEEFVNGNMLSSAYLIKDSNSRLVGWIIGGFGTHIKGNKVEYGVYADHSNGERLHFSGGTDLRVYLPKEDDMGLDNLKLTSNYGTVDKVGGDIFIDENNVVTDYVCTLYQINLSGIDPNSVDKIVITLSINK